MNITSRIYCEENLSEDFLSEEVSSRSIRSSDKIFENMEAKSLSKKRSPFYQKLCFSLADAAGDSTDDASTPSPISSKNQRKYTYPGDRPLSTFSNTLSPNMTEVNPRPSLRDDISSLLKVAAGMRHRKESTNTRKVMEQGELEKPHQPYNITMRDIKASHI